jgi:hypothetical protein
MNTTPRVAFRDAMTDIRASSRARDVFPNVSLVRYAAALAYVPGFGRPWWDGTHHESFILPQTPLPHQWSPMRERRGRGATQTRL